MYLVAPPQLHAEWGEGHPQAEPGQHLYWRVTPLAFSWAHMQGGGILDLRPARATATSRLATSSGPTGAVLIGTAPANVLHASVANVAPTDRQWSATVLSH